MIKAAFCDDDLSVLNELHVLMDNYRVERNQEITYTAFHSPAGADSADREGNVV